jgi:hypothetical protein
VLHNFNADGFDSLYPKYRGGRPKTFTLPERREIKKIAKSKPAEHGLRFSTWSLVKPARIEAPFTALRYFALDGTDHPSHKAQGSMIRRLHHLAKQPCRRRTPPQGCSQGKRRLTPDQLPRNTRPSSTLTMSGQAFAPKAASASAVPP